MTLKEIVSQISPNRDWQNSYMRHVNAFIDSAIKYDNWQDWDKDVFYEFFERSADQCVSSLKQGYFTKDEQAIIKDNWVSLSPLLKELAENQDEPNWPLYNEINKVIRQYTSQNRQAATSRLIAALQPQLLCTIVANNHLRVLFKKLQVGLQDKLFPNYENDNWAKNSYNILQYFKKELETEDSFEIMTYPWQLKDSWSPKGFNVFFDIIAQAEDIVEEQNLPFKIQEPTDYFVWISDNKNVIGNTIAHYEFHKYRNGITVNLHFEDDRTKSLFFKNIYQLPPKIIWIEWQNSKSLRYYQSFKLNEENVAHKLVNALSELNTSIGDRIREIITQIDYLEEKLHDMDKITKLLQLKKQIILQGPPGTGKTYTAKDIAEYMINEKLSANKEDQKIFLEQSDQFKLIQFHPSYTYEDFVRGIVAKPNINGEGVFYKTENKTLGEFAAKALGNFRNHKKDNATVNKEVLMDKYFKDFVDFISDKIEEDEDFLKLTQTVGLIGCDEDAFRYRSKNEGWLKNGNRMLFKDIIQAYGDGNVERKDLKKNNNLSGLARQHASYFVRVLNMFQSYLNENNLKFDEVVATVEPLKPFILIIDEINRANLPAVLGELIYALEYRGQALDSMYEIDGNRKIIIPPNLFIIGTMNTADRSVGHIDYAIRRRFAFVDVLPSGEVIDEIVPVENELRQKAKDLYMKVTALFYEKKKKENGEIDETDKTPTYLAADFKAKEVQLGHSYFLCQTKPELQLKLEYEIKPILREYVKDGVLLETASKIIEALTV
jgi:MoxR-like ATPase